MRLRVEQRVAGETFDLIACNPPYLDQRDMDELQPEVRREPALALFGGADGLDFYRRIASESFSLLRPGGHLFLEIGYGEAEEVSAILSSAGFARIGCRKDFSGIPRMIHAVAPRTEDVCSIS